jgi:hypothetical protein
MGIFSANPPADRERYNQLCQTVDLGLKNFRRVGQALKEIRDGEMHKLESLTFDELCKTRWGFTAQHAGRLITAATLVDLLEPTGYVPTSERQVRPLAALQEPDEQVAAWQEAQDAGGTTADVAAAVAKRTKKKPRPKLAKPTKLRVPGAWVTITPNKKYSGAEQSLVWAIEMLKKQQQHAA